MTEHEPGELLQEHLASDPATCAGQVCIKKTRIPAALILNALADGDTIDDVLRGHPGVTRDDLATVLAYGAKLANSATTHSKDSLGKAWGDPDESEYDQL